MRVNMQQAKNRLSELVANAEKGEPVILCRDGVPVAELRALPRPRTRSKIKTSDLGSAISREEAVAPLSGKDWGAWADE